MKTRKTLALLLLATGLISCSNEAVHKTDNGIIIDISQTNEKMALKVYADNIIRVTVSKPGLPVFENESLVTTLKPANDIPWEITNDKNAVTLSTAKINATVNTQTGEIKFTDNDGNIILQEEAGGGNLKLMLYTGADASFTLYEDEGINYNYEKGGFSESVFDYDEETKTLTLNDRKGYYKGMGEKRKIDAMFSCSKKMRQDRLFPPINLICPLFTTGKNKYLKFSKKYYHETSMIMPITYEND
jgi:uncharacterized UPF0146 family protein